MKKIILVILPLFIIGVVLLLSNPRDIVRNTRNSITNDSRSVSQNNSAEAISIVAENLDTPWAIEFVGENELLVAERNGRVVLVENGMVTPISNIAGVREIGEGGLLGIAAHPDFLSNNFIYLYYTYQSSDQGTLNKVVRMTYANKKLTDETVIVNAIPGASNHNGGRIKFGPEKLLYITTGDAQEPSESQNTRSLAGKILRVTDEGKVPPGNPFGNQVYSYGHRNGQGIAWDGATLWETEHGRSGVQSGLDEVNRIQPGKNYGWPTIQGDEQRSGMEKPVSHSGSDTWAPAGAAVLNGKLFFGGLRGSALYEMDLQTNSVREHFKNEYGRIREVIVGRDGLLYITTSNLDGRGNPHENDDKVIKVNPEYLINN